MTNSKIVTSISSTGEVETDFDLVTFSMSLTAKGKNVQKSKSELTKLTEVLQEKLKTIKKYVNLNEDTMKSTNSIREDFVYNSANKRVSDGFSSIYTLTFSTSVLDKTTSIMDTLAETHSITLNTPMFSLKNKESANKLALKDAFDKAKIRFSNECEIFGLNVKDYAIDTWKVSYSDSHRNNHSMMRSFAVTNSLEVASAPEDSTEIMAGKAITNVNLEIVFKENK